LDRSDFTDLLKQNEGIGGGAALRIFGRKIMGKSWENHWKIPQLDGIAGNIFEVGNFPWLFVSLLKGNQQYKRSVYNQESTRNRWDRTSDVGIALFQQERTESRIRIGCGAKE
jgi:hypothetical protein